LSEYITAPCERTHISLLFTLTTTYLNRKGGRRLKRGNKGKFAKEGGDRLFDFSQINDLLKIWEE